LNPFYEDEVDLATIFAHEGFVTRSTPFVSTFLFNFPFVNVEEEGTTASIIGDATGLAVVGLPGDVLRMVDEATELADSFVLSLLCEKVEWTELISVLELLPGSRFIAGRIGVEGRMGRGTRLVRRWKLPTAVSRPIF
jgi:hypothetical protein